MNILVAYLLGIVSALIPNNATRKNQERRTTDGRKESNPCEEGKRIDAEIDLSPQEAKRYYGEQQNSNRLQTRIFWVNLFTLLVLGLYTFFTACMYVANRNSANAAAEAARAATGGNDIAQVNQRAWVGLDGPIVIDRLEIVPDLRFESHYSITNFGHGPAFKVVIAGYLVTDPILEGTARAACESSIAFATGTVPMAPNLKNPGPMGKTLFPNQTSPETIGSPYDQWRGPGIPDLKHFWIVGCVGYVDQFQKPHWTRFCMEPDFWMGQQPMNAAIKIKYCALYNDTDDIKSHP